MDDSTALKPTHSTAFYYHPDGYETARSKLMGRHAAGEGFLKAYCRHSGEDTFYCYSADRKHFEHFAQKVGKSARSKWKSQWIPWTRWGQLADVGCLFMPGPDLGQLAWLRRHGDLRGFSLCGVTHTTATARVMDGLGELLTAPLQPWDAVVCTSNSVKTMVKRVIDNYGAYLQDRFSLEQRPGADFRLPVIPLGVDCAAFDPPEEKRAEARKRLRERLSIGDEDFVVLFVGRLSYHEKAHPLPMYVGLEMAARRLDKKIHLVMSGWFPSDKIKEQFRSAASALCPSVNVVCVDGRQQTVRNAIWFAADVFTSLSDNIQETFGLTPIEAMAAGLPVVVSDWDGYRETVRDGVDGYRIPTWMPPPGSAPDLALGHATGLSSYDRYVGHQSQLTSVDVESCALAFERLGKDAALRKRMGAAARERAVATFDWSVIVPAYQALWKDLAEIRRNAPESSARAGAAPANPLRDDPTALFGHYPTGNITGNTVVLPTEWSRAERLKELMSLEMNTFAKGLLFSNEDATLILALLAGKGPVTVAALASKTKPDMRRTLVFTLSWMAKMGLVRLVTIKPKGADHALPVGTVAGSGEPG